MSQNRPICSENQDPGSHPRTERNWFQRVAPETLRRPTPGKKIRWDSARRSAVRVRGFFQRILNSAQPGRVRSWRSVPTPRLPQVHEQTPFAFSERLESIKHSAPSFSGGCTSDDEPLPINKAETETVERYVVQQDNAASLLSSVALTSSLKTDITAIQRRRRRFRGGDHQHSPSTHDPRLPSAPIDQSRRHPRAESAWTAIRASSEPSRAGSKAAPDPRGARAVVATDEPAPSYHPMIDVLRIERFAETVQAIPSSQANRFQAQTLVGNMKIYIDQKEQRFHMSEK